MTRKKTTVRKKERDKDKFHYEQKKIETNNINHTEDRLTLVSNRTGINSASCRKRESAICNLA